MNKRLRILDVGALFGFPVARIFNPWNPEIIIPENAKDVLWQLHSCTERPDDQLIDLVMFGGGSDLHPSLYGHANVASGCGEIPSLRDQLELVYFRMAHKAGIPMLGICRGAQFVCAMSGGVLIQDMRGHGASEQHDIGHMIHTDDGRSFPITSTHHQLMWPEDTPHQLLAWAKPHATSKYYACINFKGPVTKEPEVVFFPKTKALGVQGHPEFCADLNLDCVSYTREVTQKYLLGEQA